MTLEILAFIFGSLLTLIGILGGGFEAKEIKIPKIAGIARLFSLIVGLSFICLGFSMPFNGGSEEKAQPNQNQKETTESIVHFSIEDEMSEKNINDKYEGQTKVHIHGRLAGTITVTALYPKSSIAVSMPNKGRYKYVLETSATWNENGQVMKVNCIGDGEIDVDNGKVYKIEGRHDGVKCIVWLKEML